MFRFDSRSAVIGLSLGALLVSAAPALALNDTAVYSCDPACATKPPKSVVMMRQVGDLDSNGAPGPINMTLAKGGKKTIVKVDWTFEWFSLGNTFRGFTIKLNNHFPAPILVVNHLDSCANGECTRSGSTWFDIDAMEALSPGQFYGQPMTLSFTSNRTVDSGSNYQFTGSMEVIKKK